MEKKSESKILSPSYLSGETRAASGDSGFTLIDPGRRRRDDTNVQREARKSGFTLIELLVVVLISAMLSAIVITYSGVGRDEVALSVESTAVAQTVLTAKSLAVTTYVNSGSGHVCGYGAVFDPSANTYSLVSYDLPFGEDLCPSVDSLTATGISAGELQQYSPSTWRIHLTAGILFDASSSPGGFLTLVLFYPPDPTTLLSFSSCSSGSGSCTYSFANQPGFLNLEAEDGGATQAISVDTTGQVSF